MSILLKKEKKKVLTMELFLLANKATDAMFSFL